MNEIKKYNIMTVLNSDYFDFGKLFVNSLYDTADLTRLNKLYVFDTGLTEIEKDYLAGFSSLEVMSTALKTKHEFLHDKDWCKNVYSKTSFLLDVVKKDMLPTIMIDSDCFFTSSFFDILPTNCDFIVCQRNDKGAFSEYIASFFVVNSVDKAEEFIKQWRDEMFYGTENHKESPALSRLINKNSFSYLAISEDIISYTGTQITDDVKIVHMKSSAELRTVKQRVHQPHFNKYLEKYLTKLPLVGGEQFLSKHYSEGKPENTNNSKLEESDAFKRLTPAQQALLIKRLKNI